MEECWKDSANTEFGAAKLLDHFCLELELPTRGRFTHDKSRK